MRTCTFAGFFLIMFAFSVVQAAPSALTYQGRILKADGSALEYSSVSFLFQVTDFSGSCVIYQEQVNGYNMVNSGGVFDIAIGNGAVQFPSSGLFTILDAFNNSSTFQCGSCVASGSSYSCSNSGSVYTAAIADTRKLRVAFYDGSGWKTISPDAVIRSVPFAGYAMSAQKLGTKAASDFVLKAEVNGNVSCSSGNFLTWDATTQTFGCSGVSGASGGTVTNVTSSNAYLSVVNGAATPQLTVNVGTVANTVAAGNDSRIVNAIQSGATASGDLTGTYPSPTVAQIRGVAVSATAPTSGQFFKYSGTNWTPAAIAISDVTNLSTTLSGYLTQAAFNTAVASGTCNADETLYWNSVSSKFMCQNITLAFAGDVSGGIATTKVTALQGRAVSTTAPTSNQVLQWDGTTWSPSTLPAGNAGTVTTVTSTSSYLVVANNTTTPALTLNVGTGVNTVAAGNDSRITNSVQNGSSATLTSVVLKDSGTKTVTVQAPTTVTTSYVLRLPAAVASVGGQMLTSDTSGNLSWTTPSTTATSYSGVLPVANGGTNSSTALTGNKVMVSNGTAIVEGPALTNGQLLVGSTGAAPVAASLTAGTGITITPAAGAITIATTGLLASSLADGKIWVGQTGTPTAVTPGGDVTMTNAGAYSVVKLQGVAVNSTAPSTAGQVLRYDGTKWTPNFVSMFDLRSTVTGTSAFGGVGCTAGQTLTWTAATDNLSCTNIAVTSSQVSFGSQTANTIFAAPSGSAGVPSFRALTTTDLPSNVLTGAGTSGRIPYYTAANTLANSEFYISTSAPLGIGVGASPGLGHGTNGNMRYFSVTGSGSGASNSAGILRLGGDTTTPAAGNLLGGVEFVSKNNPASTSIYGDAAIQVFLDGAGGAAGFGTEMAFSVKRDNSTTLSEALHISSAGYVGVGTSNPAVNLHAYSNNPGGYTIISNDNAGAGGNQWRWYSSSTGAPLGANAMCFGIGTCLFTLNSDGSAKLTGALTQASDMRLKRDVATIPDSLRKLEGLRGVTYNWIDPQKESNKQYGVIAQEVEAIFPDLVKTDKEGFKSVNYTGLIAPMINAIKELKHLFVQNDQQIQNLQKQMELKDQQMKDQAAQMEAMKKALCELGKTEFCR
ncbi:tail fiber domain-containing protein [Bdellovibrio sp. NC01]|uniref:tail fiber domain-containing protein n=1 Tax=Bdellovibrio sp. NC01 TaxID=2220073 RepID=UPI00143DBFC2|nr:tail fiber domain-containing protein [Bdellovibrio sp. NC01]